VSDGPLQFSRLFEVGEHRQCEAPFGGDTHPRSLMPNAFNAAN